MGQFAEIPPPLPVNTRAPSSRSSAAARIEEVGIAVSLLILSVITTVSTGALLMVHFREGVAPFNTGASLIPLAWIIRHPDKVSGGWPFSLTLLGILSAHEIGHYIACRMHRVESSLPWILPAPTLLGTFGAFIRLRSRLASRIALLDIGVAGPLCGMVAAIPALAAGLLLSHASDPGSYQSVAGISVTVPLLLSIVHAVVSLFDPALPPLDGSFNPHPVLVAAWIGIFITSLNLIPAGQLDGGHILYAVSPRLHRMATDGVPVLLFLAGTLFWIGWFVWGCFLLVPALRHPRVPREPAVSGTRLWLALAGFAVFLLTFTLQPFAGGSLMDYLH